MYRRKLTALAATVCAYGLVLGAEETAQQTPPAQRPAAQQGQAPREGIVGAPSRRADEGKGPFKTLAIRGVMLIDGTGAPPTGPVDVIVSGNRITAVRSAGTPGLPMRQGRGPQGDHEIDADPTLHVPLVSRRDVQIARPSSLRREASHRCVGRKGPTSR